MAIVQISMSANFTANFLPKVSIWYEFLSQYTQLFNVRKVFVRLRSPRPSIMLEISCFCKKISFILQFSMPTKIFLIEFTNKSLWPLLNPTDKCTYPQIYIHIKKMKAWYFLNIAVIPFEFLGCTHCINCKSYAKFHEHFSTGVIACYLKCTLRSWFRSSAKFSCFWILRFIQFPSRFHSHH